MHIPSSDFVANPSPPEVAAEHYDTVRTLEGIFLPSKMT